MKTPPEGLLRFFAVLVSLWFSHPARGGAILNEVLANFWYPDGYVYAVAEAGGVVYIGGDFHYVGPFTGPNAFLDPVSGARDDSYPRADGAILAAVSDGAGGMFVGGDFFTIGGVARPGLAHILANKTVDPSWAPALIPGGVSAMNLIGNTLYIAGSFSLIGPDSRTGLGAVNASTGIGTVWNPHPTSTSLVLINAMASLGNTVYVAGTFTGIGGQTRTNLAALDAVSGNAIAFSPNPNAAPSALVAAGSTVYVGGNFTKIGGQNRTNLAALDATTGNALSWPTDRPNGGVNSLSLSANTLYVSGAFNALGSVSRANIGALDTVSGNATAWNPGSGVVGTPNAGGALSVASAGSVVFVGGFFTSCGGQPRLRIAALDPATGNALAGFNPGANDTVRRVIPVGNRVFVSGDFGSIDGAKRNNIAALSATTGAATAWDASTEYYGKVNAIVASSNMVYAGGAFTNIGGQARRIIAALNTTTGAATSWNPNPVLSGGGINALLLSGDTLYVGGAHGPMGGALRTNAVALNKTTALATSWNPLPSSVIYTLAQGNGVIYAGGSFKTIGGVAMTNLAALDPTTGAATAWNPRCANTVYALAADGNALYVGGIFSRIAGQNRTNFAALNPSTGNLLSFPNPAYDFSGGGAYALALRGTNSLLVGGAAFVDTDGAGARLVELEVATGNRTSWNGSPDRPGGPFGTYVRAITVGADKIYVGGEFQGGFASFGLSGLPPQLVMPARTLSGFQFRLFGTDGQGYIIEATSNFSTWDFIDMVTPVSGFADVTDPNASLYDWRFYRASVP